MRTFNFSTELTNKVKNSQIVLNNSFQFEDCKTNQEWCEMFCEVSIKLGELDSNLVDEIIAQAIKQ